MLNFYFQKNFFKKEISPIDNNFNSLYPENIAIHEEFKSKNSVNYSTLNNLILH